jgi:hypothetical protein
MSSLKAGALLSLFSGFSFEGVQRASQKRDTRSYDMYPSPSEIAHAARFSAPAQVTSTKVAALEADAGAGAMLKDAA